MGSHAILKSHKEVNKILQDVYKDENLCEPIIEISSGCSKGDGFNSSINKITVTDNNKKLFMIMKCAPESQEFRKLVPLHDLFLREIYFYTDIYPEFVKFQAERYIEKPFNNVAKIYKWITEEYAETIVMDDIKVDGFETYSRRDYMNDEHVRFVLEKYGQFHAISFAMQDQNKKLYDRLTENLNDIWWKYNDVILNTMKINIRRAADLYIRDDETVEREALLKFEKEAIGFLHNMKIRSKYHVINHGDCWSNNMMFKYKDGKLSEIKLIDFQLCRDSSPMYDIAYFIYVSTGKDIHENLEHYLRIYYKSLTKHTSDLGSNIEKLYPFSAMKEDWKNYGKYGLILALVLLKLGMMDGDESLDLSDAAEQGLEIFENKLRNQDDINLKWKNLCSFVIRNGYL